jgi:hypothetical protein
MWIDKAGLPGIAARFKDDWLVSGQAAKLFFASTLLTVPFTPIFLGMLTISKMSSVGKLMWNVVGIAGTVAVFFLWLGMWRFWVRLDGSNGITKRVWFLVLLLGFWYGACLYYYFVYLPQVLRKNRMLG